MENSWNISQLTVWSYYRWGIFIRFSWWWSWGIMSIKKWHTWNFLKRFLLEIWAIFGNFGAKTVQSDTYKLAYMGIIFWKENPPYELRFASWWVQLTDRGNIDKISMKDPCSWRNNLFHPISGLELWSQVSRNWYILDSYFENFSWWVVHFPGYHKQTKMKYMGFSKNSFSEQIGFSLTGEAETAPYEFRFGMMIRYHK